MSEQAKEAPEKKKKGKLPMIVILAVVLGGGGFFGMKMRGGKAPKKEPEIKLGHVVEIKDEFLINMAERSTYVRAKISLQFKEGFDAAKLEAEMAPLQDAINMKLQSTSVRSVATLDGMRKLKRDIAADLNKLLSAHDEKKDEDKGKDKDKEHDEDEDKDKKGKHKEDKPGKIPEGWDSAKGPVLKVLFISFATQ
jgi:flagellar protein FliL